MLVTAVLAAVLAASPAPGAEEARPAREVTLCPGKADCPGKNPRLRSMRILHPRGARPRWAPAGDRFAFDRKNADGYYDVYISDVQGNVVASLTEGRRGIGQRNNGNPVFHPSGQYVVFISEVGRHFLDKIPSTGDPGIGLFCNLWATDPSGNRFWRLTDIPIKKRLLGRTPAMAVVNPHFSKDGSLLVWTERFDEGGHLKWGRWRVKAADFEVQAGTPVLARERVIFTPVTGNYVTAMDFLDDHRIVLAGNLDGQHEYGMDQYVYDLASGGLTNLTNTPLLWEEDSSPSGSGLVFMTNRDSPYLLDFQRNWTTQHVEREYYWLDLATGRQERLTYFNDPQAPDYVGHSAIVAASDFSPDGRYLAASLGVDFGEGSRRDMELMIVLLEMADLGPAAGGGAR